MSVLVLPAQSSSADENYRHHSHNESLLADDHDSFNIFNLSSMSVENDHLNFDELMTNCEAISHVYTSDK